MSDASTPVAGQTPLSPPDDSQYRLSSSSSAASTLDLGGVDGGDGNSCSKDNTSREVAPGMQVGHPRSPPSASGSSAKDSGSSQGGHDWASSRSGSYSPRSVMAGTRVNQTTNSQSGSASRERSGSNSSTRNGGGTACSRAHSTARSEDSEASGQVEMFSGCDYDGNGPDSNQPQDDGATTKHFQPADAQPSPATETNEIPEVVCSGNTPFKSRKARLRSIDHSMVYITSPPGSFSMVKERETEVTASTVPQQDDAATNTCAFQQLPQELLQEQQDEGAGAAVPEAGGSEGSGVLSKEGEEEEGQRCEAESAPLQRPACDPGEGFHDGWNWFGAGFNPMRRCKSEVSNTATPSSGTAVANGAVNEADAPSPFAPLVEPQTVRSGWEWFGTGLSSFAQQSYSALGAFAALPSSGDAVSDVGLGGHLSILPAEGTRSPALQDSAGFHHGWNWFGAGFSPFERRPFPPDIARPRHEVQISPSTYGDCSVVMETPQRQATEVTETLSSPTSLGYAFLMATVIHAAALQASATVAPLSPSPHGQCSVAVQTHDTRGLPPVPFSLMMEETSSILPAVESTAATNAETPVHKVYSNQVADPSDVCGTDDSHHTAVTACDTPSTPSTLVTKSTVQGPHPHRHAFSRRIPQAESNCTLPPCLSNAHASSSSSAVHDRSICPFVRVASPPAGLDALADAEHRERRKLALTWLNRLLQHERTFVQELRALEQQWARRTTMTRPRGEFHRPSEPPESPAIAGVYWLQRGESECRAQILHFEALHWQALAEWESRPQMNFPFTPTKRHHQCQPVWQGGSATFDRISLGVQLLEGHYVALDRPTRGGACGGLCSRVPCGRHTYAWVVELCTDCPYLELGFAAGNMLRDGHLNGKCSAGFLFRLIDGRVAILNKARFKHFPLTGPALFRRGSTLTLTLDAARQELTLACGGRTLGPVYRCTKGPFPYPLFPAFHCALHTERYVFRVELM
eukprot:GGOE01045200.1.p1 GENE.GGOE01045200.1~~GGOE01045200.1.p1  ORF type:complete len:974 (-),score=142.77 GGOE01045200.1:136-3057(-)